MPDLNWGSESAVCVAAIMRQHFPDCTVLDVNYGQGVFYRRCPQSLRVIGVDVSVAGGAHVQADNRFLPFCNDAFDVAVCDPPYRQGHGVNRFGGRYGENVPDTAHQVTKQYLQALPEMLRVARCGLVIKLQDESDGHRFIDRRYDLTAWMLGHTGLRPHDVLYVARRAIRENNLPRNRRRFMANGVSMFLVYQWHSKAPFRGKRY